MAYYEYDVVCNLGQRRHTPCGPEYVDLKTLGELDATAPNTGALGLSHGGLGSSAAGTSSGNKQKKKLSWIILSRAGVNFLLPSAAYRSWTICQNHTREFLDDWYPEVVCCYPTHQEDFTEASKPKETVTLVIAVKTLQSLGKVVPVGGKVCTTCHQAFEERCGKKKSPGAGQQQIYIVVQRGQALPPSATCSLAVPSPFIKPDPDAADVPAATSTRPPRATTSALEDSAAIFIKTEVGDENEVTFRHESDLPSSTAPVRRRRRHNLTEDDLSDDGSDDDRTWRPNREEHSSASEGEEEEEEEEDSNGEQGALSRGTAISDGSSADLHYYCRICQITFYKHTSYKQHMRNSKKIHRELQKKNKEAQEEEAEVPVEDEYECSDCCIAFKDRSAQLKHLASVHHGGKAQKGSFFCSICKVSLRSESAFRSHNSKLHLERDSKSYYCRECDEIFSCKVKHQNHIKSHRMFSGDDPGLQCLNCGKVFLSSQQMTYQRHLATHEFDTDYLKAPCECSACKKADGDLAPSAKKPKTGKSANLFKMMQSKFAGMEGERGDDGNEGEEEPEAEEAATDDEDPLSTKDMFECGICHKKFGTVDELAKHVEQDHQMPDPVAQQSTEDEHPEDVEEEEHLEENPKGADERPNAPQQKVQPVKTVGPDGMDRNWAATFGYGRTTTLKSSQSFDLISQMQEKFKRSSGRGRRNVAVEEDEEEEDIEVIKEEIADVTNEHPRGTGEIEDDEFKIYRVRGFKGRIKASLKKTPRTLSDSSRSARKRMEMLIKSAREQWAKKQKRKSALKSSPVVTAKKQAPNKRKRTRTHKEERQASKKRVTFADQLSSSKKRTALPATLEVDKDESDTESQDSDDSDWDGIEDDDEGLLIPLANSWVCEKRPSEDRSKWVTFFWSPEGEQYNSVAEVAASQTRSGQTLDMAVFQRAWNKNLGRLPDKGSKQPTGKSTRANRGGPIDSRAENERFLEQIDECIKEATTTTEVTNERLVTLSPRTRKSTSRT